MAFRRPLHISDLPKTLLCIPLVLHWFWLALRYRSLTLPSCLNPFIDTGGLAGESKSACLAQIGGEFDGHVASWVKVAPGQDPLARRLEAGIGYPVVAKPDIGWCGYGVRRVEDDEELAAYAAAFPRDADFMVQRLIEDPNEAGLFYVRIPGEACGSILAMTLRHAPHITGDGVHDVAALMKAAGRAESSGTTAPAAPRRYVPALDERVVLTTVASLRVGAVYQDATSQISQMLAERVDLLARSMPELHVARFDVRFATLESLQQAKFQVIEVNGAGSEAIHLWDPSLSLRDAFRGVFTKQRMLFELGAMMRAKGHAAVGPLALARAWLRQQRLISRYPDSN